MIRTTCDHCGAELKTFPWTNVDFPFYIITCTDASDTDPRPIDLCHNCKKLFTKWPENGHVIKAESVESE